MSIHEDRRPGTADPIPLDRRASAHASRQRQRFSFPRRKKQPHVVLDAPDAEAAAFESPESLLTRRALAQHGLYGVMMLTAGGLLSACGGAGSTGTVPTGAAVAGGGKEIANLDWILAYDAVTLDFPLAADGGSLAIVPSILDSVFTYDAKTVTLQPALATAHRFLDPRTIVLTIREGVKFHDGSPLTAEDVAFSLSRHLDKKVGSYFSQYYASVKSFEATGPNEVTIKLSKPDAGVVPALGTIAGFIGSKAFIEQHGKKTGTATVGMIGTGPYRFVSWRHGQQIVLERFDEYWNKAHVALKVKRFTGHVLSDVSTQIQSLRSGEMDGTIATGLTGKQVRQLAQDPKLHVSNISFPAAVSLILNVNKPPFDDVRVRHAMAYAIDRKTLLSSVQGDVGTLVKSIAPPSSWGYERARFQAAYDALEGYDYDPAKAKQLIAEAGAKGATGELWALPATKELAAALQSAAKDAGLNLSVRVVDIAQFTQEAASPKRSYAGLLSLYSALYPDPGNLFSGLYATGAPGNATGYSNKQVDAKLALEKTLTTDDARRADLIIEVQKQVTKDSAFVPLWTFEAPVVLKKGIGGFVPNPYRVSYIENLSASA